MDSMRHRRRVLWLVRVLTGTGLLVVITTLAVVGRELRHVRAERTAMTAEQQRLNQASDQLRQFAAQNRAELQDTLDSSEASPDIWAAATNLKTYLQSELSSMRCLNSTSRSRTSATSHIRPPSGGRNPTWSRRTSTTVARSAGCASWYRN
jgi:hypothetical protein